jgi:hypothetical protein
MLGAHRPLALQCSPFSANRSICCGTQRRADLRLLWRSMGRDVADLKAQRLMLLGQRRRADAEMQRLAFRAHAHGNTEAGKELTELRQEAIRRDQEIAAVEWAISRHKEVA